MPDFRDFVGCVQRPHREPPTTSGEQQQQPQQPQQPQQQQQQQPTAAAAAEEAGASWGARPYEEAAAGDGVTGPGPQQPLAPVQGGAAQGGAAGQTWRHMQVATDVMEGRAADADADANATATANANQKGLTNVARPDYRKSMPLGNRPNVTPLGTNMRHQLERSSARTNKFSSGFNPDHYL